MLPVSAGSGTGIVAPERVWGLVFWEINVFQTSIAGSLPKPAWLSETQKLWPEWKARGAELQRAKADATLRWIKAHEDAGLDILGDREQSRQHFVHGFLEQVQGIDFQNKVTIGIRHAMTPKCRRWWDRWCSRVACMLLGRNWRARTPGSCSSSRYPARSPLWTRWLISFMVTKSTWLSLLLASMNREIAVRKHEGLAAGAALTRQCYGTTGMS